ncbi:MAG: type B DNA-directed DNA polymerase [Methanolinea sp.]|nr:type B DNA-directed DNA polymerase [Methanolinea sp.]
MWILDSLSRNDIVEFWGKGRGGGHLSVRAPASFLLHLPDPSFYRDLVEGLESYYRVDECTITTVSGVREGYRVWAGKDVAALVEAQTRYTAQIYNADIRPDLRVMAEGGLYPCGEGEESRFSVDLAPTLSVMEVVAGGNPFTQGPVASLTLQGEGEKVRLEGEERTVLSDLSGLLLSLDPDVILFPHADLWVPRVVAHARELGIDTGLSRSGKFRRLSQKSYWSYGRTEFRVGALVPDGRLLVDTLQSFHYRESGLFGILLGSRLSCLPPNLVARFTSGTLISSYEVYEALRRGIAVPWRKADAEEVRRLPSLKAADRGGLMFQPRPGIYPCVHEIDFTSLYPSLIVRDNLSPETLSAPGRKGFLPEVLAPLIALRLETKRAKSHDPRYRGPDSLLKWMLVTCFGYTGYRNAKFGRIEVHEAITARARDVLLHTRDIAEEMGFSVLHGIVDCLWVRGGDVYPFKERVERETRLHTVVDTYDWIVFLPMADGSGAYTRYYGRFPDGSMKVRGIAARRGDTPDFVRNAQEEMLGVLAEARTIPEVAALRDPLTAIYRRVAGELPGARPCEMAISRRISTVRYRHSCAEASAVEACRGEGIGIVPGMEVRFVVTDARTWEVELDGKAARFDVAYYRKLLQKAWEEVIFAVERAEQEVRDRKGPGKS